MSTPHAAPITKHAPALVAPREPTPGGAVALSALDRLLGMRLSRDLVLVFPRGGRDHDHPALALREGLARALVPYYPVAGRLVEPSPGALAVDCTGEGVWFVEAAAACALDDVDCLGGSAPRLLIPKADLVARPPPGVNKDDVVFMMQVTEFKCGGVAVGITYNHLVFDGLGAAQFVNAVAEMARGLAELSVSPTWRRESIVGPAATKPAPAQQGPAPPQPTLYRFHPLRFDVPLESINRVKDRVRSESGLECTTFEAVTAMTWRSRTRAIRRPSGPPYAGDVRLNFMANARPALCDLLDIGSGYYGNCVYPLGISAPGERVANGSLTELVAQIREAKQTVAAELAGWLAGDAAKEYFDVPLNYGTLVVTEWTRLGYGDVDYGSGGPSYVLPMTGELSALGTCVYVRPPVPAPGLRLMLHCVEERHAAALREELEMSVSF